MVAESCVEACKRNFELTKVLFGPAVCQECQGCIMAQVYKETGGKHPSTERLIVQTDRANQYAVLGSVDGGEEPAA